MVVRVWLNSKEVSFEYEEKDGFIARNPGMCVFPNLRC